ncbi:MAG: hypothetical protein QM749_09625 [Aquabacterium sp.]
MESEKLDLLHLTMAHELEKTKIQFEQFKAGLGHQAADAKAELERFKGDLCAQVADAKVHIGEMAVEKMSKVFNEVRVWVIAVVVGLFGVGGLGYYQVSSTVERTITSKINDWLSFDKKGAILKDTLEATRTRVILDALVIKMERSKLSNQYRPELDLSHAEIDRLTTYMKDPNTPPNDFRDGARVIAAHFGPFYPGNDPQVDALIEAIFRKIRLDDPRAEILLQSLKRYPTMLGYANELLKKDELPDSLRLAAFDVLATEKASAATDYATAHLPTEPWPVLQWALAKHLSTKQNAVGIVDHWLKNQATPEDSTLKSIALADQLSPAIYSTFQFEEDAAYRRWAIARAATLVVSAIANGARLNVCDSRGIAGQSLCFIVKRSSSLTSPDSLFQHGDLFLKAMLDVAATTKLPPETLIRGLTAQGAHGELFALQVEPGTHGFTGATFGQINDKTTASALMLVKQPSDINHPIHVTFRAKDGRWIDDVVVSYGDFYKSTVHFAYDQNLLEMAQRRQLNENISFD